MRLTNTLRDAFVSSVMNDVPQIDYSEQARKLINEHLDSEFTKIFGNKLTRKEAMDSGWLPASSVKTPMGINNLFTASPGYTCLTTVPKLWKQLEALAEKKRAQDAARQALMDKIRGAANSVTTRKALVELLPEFEKYLPADEAKAHKVMLPAVANIVSDFVKAGWPKNQPKQATTKATNVPSQAPIAA